MGEKKMMSNEFSKEQKSVYGSISDEHITISKGEATLTKKKFTKTQWMTLITLAFGNFCAGACMSLQAPFFPAEAERKGATATEYGLIFGVFQLTVFISAPVMGKLVGCISPNFILNVSVFTIGVTCTLFGTLDLIMDTTSFVALALVIRMFEGVGAAALKTSCYTIIASQFPEGMGTTFAILETFLGVGLITGPTLGGVLYDLGGYGLPFYTVGSVVLIDAVVICFVLPSAGSRSLVKKGNMIKFWMHQTTLTYAFSVFTAFIYVGLNQAGLEPHLREFKLSGVFIGMLFALCGTAYAITAPGWGWLCDKKCDSLYLSLAGCFFIISSSLLIGPAPFFNTGPNLALVIVSLLLWGLGMGAKLVSAFSGTLTGTINRGFPADVSTYGMVSSMFASSQSLGAFVGPSVGGYLLDTIGFQKASMSIFTLESFLVIVLIVSIVNKKRTASLSIAKAEKFNTSFRNGYMSPEKESAKDSMQNFK